MEEANSIIHHVNKNNTSSDQPSINVRCNSATSSPLNITIDSKSMFKCATHSADDKEKASIEKSTIGVMSNEVTGKGTHKSVTKHQSPSVASTAPAVRKTVKASSRAANAHRNNTAQNAKRVANFAMQPNPRGNLVSHINMEMHQSASSSRPLFATASLANPNGRGGSANSLQPPQPHNYGTLHTGGSAERLSNPAHSAACSDPYCSKCPQEPNATAATPSNLFRNHHQPQQSHFPHNRVVLPNGAQQTNSVMNHHLRSTLHGHSSSQTNGAPYSDSKTVQLPTVLHHAPQTNDNHVQTKLDTSSTHSPSQPFEAVWKYMGFKCMLCNVYKQEFKTQGRFLSHFYDCHVQPNNLVHAHSGYDYKCCECKLYFVSQDDLQDHSCYSDSRNSERNQTKLCNTRSSDYHALDLSRHSSHAPNNLHKTFSSGASMDQFNPQLASVLSSGGESSSRMSKQAYPAAMLFSKNTKNSQIPLSSSQSLPQIEKPYQSHNSIHHETYIRNRVVQSSMNLNSLSNSKELQPSSKQNLIQHDNSILFHDFEPENQSQKTNREQSQNESNSFDKNSSSETLQKESLKENENQSSDAQIQSIAGDEPSAMDNDSSNSQSAYNNCLTMNVKSINPFMKCQAKNSPKEFNSNNNGNEEALGVFSLTKGKKLINNNNLDIQIATRQQNESLQFLSDMLPFILVEGTLMDSVSRTRILRYLAYVYNAPNIAQMHQECNKAIKIVYPNAEMKRRGNKKKYRYHGLKFRPELLSNLYSSMKISRNKLREMEDFLEDELDCTNIAEDYWKLCPLVPLSHYSKKNNLYGDEMLQSITPHAGDFKQAINQSIAKSASNVASLVMTPSETARYRDKVGNDEYVAQNEPDRYLVDHFAKESAPKITKYDSTMEEPIEKIIISPEIIESNESENDNQVKLQNEAHATKKSNASRQTAKTGKQTPKGKSAP